MHDEQTCRARPPLAGAPAIVLAVGFVTTAILATLLGIAARSLLVAVLVGVAGVAVALWIYAAVVRFFHVSILRWTEGQLLVREGSRSWSVSRGEGLTSRSVRVQVGGSSNDYLWILAADGRPLARLRLTVWPREAIRAAITAVGCPDPALDNLPVETARQLRRQDRRLISFWHGHGTEISVLATLATIIGITLLTTK